MALHIEVQHYGNKWTVADAFGTFDDLDAAKDYAREYVDSWFHWRIVGDEGGVYYDPDRPHLEVTHDD